MRRSIRGMGYLQEEDDEESKTSKEGSYGSRYRKVIWQRFLNVFNCGCIRKREIDDSCV